MAENTEVGSGTSSTIRSAENSSSDMTEDAEVGGNGNCGDDKTVKRSPSRKLSEPTEYLTFLRSDANSAFFEKR